MSDNSRPFEVGDFVVLDKMQGVVIAIKNNCVVMQFGDKKVTDYVSKYHSHILHEVLYPTAIRNPRKGSKDARDIVAVACLTYIMMLDKRFRHLKMVGYEKHEAFLKAKEYAQDTAAYDIYQEQKAMLK